MLLEKIWKKPVVLDAPQGRGEELERFAVVRPSELIGATPSTQSLDAYPSWLADVVPGFEKFHLSRSETELPVVGQVVSADRHVQGLVQAMASFAPSAAADSGVARTYASAISAVIAASTLQ